jgi:ligand-binding SRPBCC domain-containing protein
MPVIELITEIEAPVERCFLLSLSVDLHKLSTRETNETAIAGVTSGIMELNDKVTWRAKHFGVYQTMTNRISAYVYPSYFVSEMVKGIFKKIYHQHFFSEKNGKTIMRDNFAFEAPLGLIGRLFSKLILTNYMKRFLEIRNKTIKDIAQGNKGNELLNKKTERNGNG